MSLAEGSITPDRAVIIRVALEEVDRALAGDKTAARQLLQRLGMIDSNGQLIPPYRPEDLND